MIFSSDGYTIRRVKTILSFYSNLIKDILIDPVLVHSEKVPTVYFPATNSCIIQLFKILTKCKVYSSKDVSIQELSDLIDVLGIENFDVGESEMVVENFDDGESEKVVENLTNDSNQVEVENSYNNENHE